MQPLFASLCSHCLPPRPADQLAAVRVHSAPAGVWEGQFLVPGSGAFLLTADALAGSGDVAGLLGEREVRMAAAR